MLERVIMFCLNNQWLVKGVGSVSMSLASVLAALGLRFDRLDGRMTRALSGTGVEVPDTLSKMPWVIQAATPQSALGWILVIAAFAIGAWLFAVPSMLKKFGM